MATQGVDPLRRYFDARSNLEALEGSLADMGKVHAGLGQALRESPVRIMIADGKFEAPEYIAVGAPTIITPEEWPSWDQFRTTLETYYRAQAEVKEAARQLSPSEKQILRLS